MNSNVFNDRNYKKLYQASKLQVLPAFVKDATPAEEQNFDKTASVVFADPSQRRYPLDTKSNTWLSRMYFELDKEASYDKHAAGVVGDRIKDASVFWQLDDTEFLPVQEKEAYEFPLTLNGQPVHTVRIETREQYKQAADDLKGSFEKLAYNHRRELARGLYLAPEQFKTELSEDVSEYLEKAAGFGMSTRHQVGQAILNRVCLLRDRPAYADKLTAVSQSLPETMNIKTLDKVAEILDNIDRDCDFVRYYGRGINLPEEDCFYVTEKTASLLKDEMIILSNGNAIHKTAVLKDDKGVIDMFFDQYFGERPYGDMQEKLAVIQSLPAQDATALQDLTGLA